MDANDMKSLEKNIDESDTFFTIFMKIKIIKKTIPEYSNKKLFLGTVVPYLQYSLHLDHKTMFIFSINSTLEIKD